MSEAHCAISWLSTSNWPLRASIRYAQTGGIGQAARVPTARPGGAMRFAYCALRLSCPAKKAVPKWRRRAVWRFVPSPLAFPG
jgi:hypothetical protein